MEEKQQKIEQIDRAIAALNTLPVTGIGAMQQMISAVQLLIEYKARIIGEGGNHADHQNQ